MKQAPHSRASRPISAALLATGLAALFILLYRLLAGKSGTAIDAEADALATTAIAFDDAAPATTAVAFEPPTPPLPPPLPPHPLETSRPKRLLQAGVAHPFASAMLVMTLVVFLTFAYLQVAGSTDADLLARQPPSKYDEYFNYRQMQAMWHFAMCDAMLFSTKPEDEIEKVKERIAVAVEYTGPSGASHPDAYKSRIRTAAEIVEAIRLAEEFYERVNCQ